MTADLVPTPGQTVGPFFGHALPFERGGELVPRSHPGAVRLYGLVLDGAGQSVPDAMIEVWQPDPDGAVVRREGSLRRDGWTFTGWGRAATDASGRYGFSTLVPGAPEPDSAAFFALTVFARGLLDRLFTRAYLPGADDDPFLAALPVERRRTLVAVEESDGYRFDIRLQGENETVFLALGGG